MSDEDYARGWQDGKADRDPDPRYVAYGAKGNSQHLSDERRKTMISLGQIVAALSVTYTDSGVAMWLASRNSGLGGAAPIDVIARDPLDGLRRVAELVSLIGDADPTDAEERPEDTVRRYARAIVRVEALLTRMEEGFCDVSDFAIELLRAAINTEGAPF